MTDETEKDKQDMTQKQIGGPAFPHQSDQYPQFNGMTLRDYAVIEYVAAMLAHPRRYKPREEDSGLHWIDAIHAEAGDLADAMIAARDA